MANNVLTGRLFDETDTFIGDNSVRYFGIHKSGALVTVSETRVSEDGFYNFNLGDPDWLGQDRQALANDDIAIVVWQDQSQPVQSISLSRFAVHFFKHTGLDVYVKDLQLLPPQAPSCQFTVNGYYDIGELVTVNNQSSSMYQWEYNELTHWHRDSVLGVPLFSVGLTTEYTFNDFITNSNQHTFDSMGVYDIRVLNTSLFGVTSECSQQINVTYRPPTTTITYSPSQIQLGTQLEADYSTIDIDDTVTHIEYFINGVAVGNGADLTFSTLYTIQEVKSTELKAVVYWNDGFNDQVSTFTETIQVENQPPVTALTHTIDTNVITAEHESYDPDGEIVSYTWEIYYTLPFSDEVRLVYEETEAVHTSKTFTMPTGGEYKIKLIVTDNLGATGFDEFITNVGSVGDCVPNLIICDTVIQKDIQPKTFAININNNTFNINSEHNSFTYNQSEYTFGVETHQYQFNLNTHVYSFTASKDC